MIQQLRLLFWIVFRLFSIWFGFGFLFSRFGLHRLEISGLLFLCCYLPPTRTKIIHLSPIHLEKFGFISLPERLLMVLIISQRNLSLISFSLFANIF